MCAVRAAIGKVGIGNLAVCVDTIVDPLGFRMVMGFVAICLFRTGKSTVKNVSVLPVLAITVQYDKGGPVCKVTD